MSLGNEPRLRRLFAQEAAGRIAELVDAARAIRDADDATELVARMSRDAQALHRGAGVIGLPHVRDLAGALDDLVSTFGERASVPAPADVDLLVAAADALRVLLGLAPGEDMDAAALREQLARRAASVGADHDASTPTRWRHHDEPAARQPTTGSTIACLVVCAGGQPFALPLARVKRVAAPDDVTLRARHGGPVRPLDEELGLSGATAAAVVVVRSRDEDAAFGVERLLGHRELVVHSLAGVIPPSPLVAGAAVDAEHGLLVVLDADGLVGAGAHGRVGASP